MESQLDTVVLQCHRYFVSYWGYYRLPIVEHNWHVVTWAFGFWPGVWGMRFKLPRRLEAGVSSGFQQCSRLVNIDIPTAWRVAHAYSIPDHEKALQLIPQMLEPRV